MKISVIVPVYNTEKYLNKCLDSLVKQTITDWEIIIINDGSTDGSDKIINRYKKAYPQLIRAKKIPNGGVGNARNMGLKMAKGDYIAFLDSDDCVVNDAYLLLYQKAMKTHADIVACAYYTVRGEVINKRKTEMDEEFGHSIIDNPKIFTKSTPFCWAHIYKRELINKNKVRFTDHKMFEDLLFVYKCYKHANKIVKVYEPLVYYTIRQDGSSVTQGFKQANFCLFDVMSKLKDYYNGVIPNEYLTYVAINHIFIRLRRKTALSDFSRKRKFIKEAFTFLDNYDCDWHHNLYFNASFKKYHFSINYWSIKTLFKGTNK